MNTKKRNSNLTETLHDIETGNFKRSDVSVLLLNLRHQGSNEIDDLANFVGHPDGRNSGKTYRSVQKFVQENLSDLDSGSITGEVPVPLYSSGKIMDELVTILVKLGVSFNETLFRKQVSAIITAIYANIHQTSIVLKNPRVPKCWLAKGKDGKIHLFFTVDTTKQTKGWPISFVNPQEFIITCPLFDI